MDSHRAGYDPRRCSLADLFIDWPAASDGSGIAGYQVGWTEPHADPRPDRQLTPYPAAGRHAQVIGEAQKRYAHVVTAR